MSRCFLRACKVMLFRLRRRRRRRCQASRRVKGCRFVLSVNLDPAIKPLSKHNSFCMQLYIIFPLAPHPGPPQQTRHSLPIPLIPPPFPLLATSHTTVNPRPSPWFSSPSPSLTAHPASLSLSPASHHVTSITAQECNLCKSALLFLKSLG